jgi:formylglycine-generating enzyme required for sulfatase activity
MLTKASVAIGIFLIVTFGTPTRSVQAAGQFDKVEADLENVNFRALRMAIEDLKKTYPDRYVRGEQYLTELDSWEKQLPAVKKALGRGEKRALGQVERIVALKHEVLLANPLMDFDRLLLIKRKPDGDPRRGKAPDRGLGIFLGFPRQSSWQLPKIEKPFFWENEIAVLSPVRGDGRLSTLYKPETRKLLTDMDLAFDGDKIMFSMPGSNKKWQLFEIDTDGRGLRQISPSSQPDVHNFDGCYLPNGRIAFISTATFQCVPCNSGVDVGMTYLMDADGRNVRQLCFEQDHNFSPTVMNDGRILYLRWEYTDIPHVWARFLFTMNPDGTGQREYYGSGSYWPNGIWYARPIPGHPTKVVGIVTGHHVGRVGELAIFDPAISRYSTDGVVQRIPGYGKKVEPVIEDKLNIDCWPKFLHPYPLSEKYFLVSCKPKPEDLWGIYLVDVFDNMVLLKEVEGYALFEPLVLRKTKTPPVIVDRVDLARKDAIVYLEDIYAGPGLKDTPHGSVKKLRLFTYHFAYQKYAGINNRVGTDGPWEPKRVLGTVPLEEDGSSFFRVPANTPISIQPLDSQGRALQLMRSWFTAMPGELVSCTGCHEKQNSAPPNRRTIAISKKPTEITPWYGPVRGFSFKREVQPVLDKYCVGCHDGSQRADGQSIPDLRGDQDKFYVFKNGDPDLKVIDTVPRTELLKKYAGVFEPAFIELRRYVRVGGLESDLRLLAPGEFHTDTSELFQMLRKGHHGVELDEEAWDRLTVWVDLNAPCHGTWRETGGVRTTAAHRERRRTLAMLYAGIDEDPEAIPDRPKRTIKPITPKVFAKAVVNVPKVTGWPFDSAEAKRRQAGAGARIEHSIDLGDGVKLDMVLIPTGEFVMGDKDGEEDELPLTRVKIVKPFWMGKFEVTNEQYARFDPSHDSRFEHAGSMIFSEKALGPKLNKPKQPVVRVSQKETTAFCRWLSTRVGQKVTLPSEAQWEYACRAGTDGPLFFGDIDTDFSKYANMADAKIKKFASWVASDSPDIIPRDARFNDNQLVTADVGRYRPNAWGLYDMHGNAWEWTRSAYRAYPYTDEANGADGDKTVRGGSWYDRAKRCRSAFRLSYPAWQKVYNVSFRVVIESGVGRPAFVQAAERK